MPLTVSFQHAMDAVPAAAWDALDGTGNPFLRHALLRAFETQDCVGEHLGWIPLHATVHDAAGQLVGAMPMYVKGHYYGEFVFDWAWDEAYRRAGLDYYPKLVIAVPYTPATGTRLLCHPDANRDAVRRALLEGVKRLTDSGQFSSAHWLFPCDDDLRFLRDAGLIERVGCNFHWHNQGYRDFDDFLDTLTAEKRKKVKRERRRVAEQGVTLTRQAGREISDTMIGDFYRFYVDTFDKHLGHATLTEGFFRAARDALGEDMILVLAHHAGQTVAGALFFKDRETLFGRYWGCARDYHSLHFEACYYQGHEIAIEHGLARFEPGVQGEHKVARGFLPTRTRSMHWIAHPRFRLAIADFCRREQALMEDYCRSVYSHSPYKEASTPPAQRLTAP